MTRLQEVTIDEESVEVVEWGMKIGNPSDRPMPPVLLFLARDLPAALQDGGLSIGFDRHLAVTPDGFATATEDGVSYIYELFPARFTRDPYDPACYVGRWPD